MGHSHEDFAADQDWNHRVQAGTPIRSDGGKVHDPVPLPHRVTGSGQLGRALLKFPPGDHS